jgi:hypothetical protein
MKKTVYTVNQKGLQEIHDFLGRAHKLGYDHFDRSMLRAWAADAESQLDDGNPAEIEIPRWDSVTGATVTYRISAAGLDADEIEI